LGQKVNPIGFRVSVTKDWRSKWYSSNKEFGGLLHEDLAIRKFIEKNLSAAGVPEVIIKRDSNRVQITLRTSRPGIVIGRKGSEIDKIKDGLADITSKEIFIDVEEIKRPETEALLVAQNIAMQLMHRVSFRKAMKRSIRSAMDFGAQGIKVTVSGRIGGAEMSRTESAKEGKIPLHTLRASIDYGFVQAFTAFGAIGVKTWIYKGERQTVKGGQ
jgi:small subunit ribosomal protein S3